MENKNVSAIQYDHQVMDLSYRSLAKKYGINRKEVHRIVMSKHNKQRKAAVARKVKEELGLPDDINLLKEELRKARIKIELQDMMLDISSKELGIDLRKKHGTRQSE